jgi:CheY-like chemotaxis protein
MSKNYNYIIIDDSQIDIFIATKMIQNAIDEPIIQSFIYATEALESIKNTSANTIQTIVFVDINMPLMNGFEFMAEFEKLPIEIQNLYIPYFLTSSINESDISKAKTFITAKDYINKPLTQQSIQNLLSKLV